MALLLLDYCFSLKSDGRASFSKSIFSESVEKVVSRSKWIIVDQSLTGPGNHHYEYARLMATAALSAGYEVHVIGNCQMRSDGWDELPVSIYPAIRFTTYDRPVRLAPSAREGRRLFPNRLRSWFGALRERKYRRACIEFAERIRRLLSHIGLSDRDHIFFPTLSVHDLKALDHFWSRTEVGRQSTWHLQFHFELPDEITHSSAERWRAAPHVPADSGEDCFRAFRDNSLPYRFLFYCPTESMATRYNALGIGQFVELPYPVHVVPAGPWEGVYPLKICCAGHVRRDKGRFELAQLVELLWEPLSQGEIQLWLQGSRHKYRTLPAQALRHPSALRLVPHPLPTPQYVQLIASADIGLFLYDPNTFRRRCSGVLVEMLAAGIPVVVPAGTWLSQQLESAGAEHVASGTTRDLSARSVGRVGLIANSTEDFAEAIHRMVKHYPHFRSSASHFGESWRERHSPENALRIMLERAASIYPPCVRPDCRYSIRPTTHTRSKVFTNPYATGNLRFLPKAPRTWCTGITHDL